MHLDFKSALRPIIIFLSLLISELAPAQNDTLVTDSTSITSNLIEYTDYIAVRFAVNNNFNSFYLGDLINDSGFNLTPNQRLRSVFTVHFRFVDIDIGFTPHFLKFNDDDESKGKTSFSGMGFRFYFGKWMQNVQWSTTKGFYVDLGEVNADSEENLLFPDMRVFKIHGETSYVFNDNYSFKSIIKQNEWQKRSAGSFVPSARYSYTQLSNKGPETDRIYNFSVGPSYHYNLIIARNFLVSAGLFLGAGYNYTSFEFDDDRENYHVSGLVVNSEVKLALGYNSTRFFAGGHVNFNSFSYNVDPDLSLIEKQQVLEFYVGYRFKAPKALIKFTEDAQSKIGL